MAGDLPNMSSARDQSLVDKILEVSKDIDRHVALCRGESDSLFSFLAAQAYSQQVVYLSSTPPPSDGTFLLSFGGQLTGSLAFDADASVVQAALEGLSTVGSGNVTVSGFAGGPYTVDFAGALSGPQPTITGRASFSAMDASVVVLPMIQGVFPVYSERRFYASPPLYGFLLPIDDCVEIDEVRLYSGGSYSTTTEYTPYPLRGTPIEGLKTTNGLDWPLAPDYTGVVARWGHRTEVPYDVRETAIIEVIRSHFSGQAGNDDRLGMTPFGRVITSKAFTDKYKALVGEYGKKLW